MNSRFKKLALDTTIFALGNFLVKFIQFFLLPLYTSVMTTDQYGTAELINNLSELCYPIFCLCIYEALFRLAIDTSIDKKKLFTNGIVIIGISLPVAAIIMFLCYKLADFQYAAYLFLLLVVISLKTIFAQFARGIGCIKEFAISGIINILSLFFLNMFLLVYMRMGVFAYLVSLILSNIVAIVYLFFSCKLYQYLIFEMDYYMLKQMLIYCLPLIPNTLTWWFMNIFDRYVVLFACGAELTGIFIATCKLPSIINLFSNIFQQAWQITSAKELNSPDSRVFFSEVFKFYSALVITVCSLLIALSERLAFFLLKGDFFSGWKYLPLLMLSAMINCYAIYFGTIYTAVKDTSRILITTVIGTMLNIIFVFALVNLIGIYAALFAMLTGYTFIALFRAIDTQKYIQLVINWKYHIIAYSIILIQTLIISLNLRHCTFYAILLWILLFVYDAIIFGSKSLCLLRSFLQRKY